MPRPTKVARQDKQSEDERPSRDALLVNSVEKSMRVLRAFDGTHRRLSLSQISAATGLNLSSAQRFTYSLHQLGYLQKDAQNRLYSLSPRTLEIGFHYLQSSDLIARAQPYLLHLHKTFLETTNLTVLDGTEIVFVSRFLSRNIFNVDVIVGTRLPAFCTAPGLAILANLDPANVRTLLEQSNRQAFTSHTITDVNTILDRLPSIRAKGYAVVHDEMFLGDISVAAAVLDSAGHPEGALNVACSSSQWTADSAEREFASTVFATAAAVSKKRSVTKNIG